ncbi:MAG: Ig-like domain-containing protein [Actinomycetota bacterium]|nr:Ig-like domain-containing protein [Actinomycetota bacterium]
MSGPVAVVALSNRDAISTADAGVRPAAAVATSSASSQVAVRAEPGRSTRDVPLNAPVNIAVERGSIQSVSVAPKGGRALSGEIDPAGTSWRSSATLDPAATYVVEVVAKGTGGEVQHHLSTFSTLTPKYKLYASISPGGTVGVGMPVVVSFDAPVTDRAAVQKRLSMTMSTPVEGAWSWMGNREVHFRPKNYWPVGEQVTVSADLAGLDAGGNVWGFGSAKTSFTVGNSHISTVDANAHTMTVSVNGSVARVMPASTGREKYPTMSGVHIAQYKTADVIMDSATTGIPRNDPDGYYEHVAWNVAITDGGEFVHAAPWSVADQGRRNVSHGCVNLADDQAKWFYDLTLPGDIIQVVGTPRPASLSDGGTVDWNTSWSAWVKGDALA